MGQPEQSKKVNRHLPGDHGDDGTRHVFRPAKIGKPADEERRRHEAGQVSVTGRARRCGEDGKAHEAFGDVEKHRGGAKPSAQGRAAEQNGEGLAGDGHGREWQRDGEVRHQPGKETEGDDQAQVAE